MKEININQMALINGGGFWSGFCFAAGLAGLFGNPVGGVITVGCLVYAGFSA